MNRNTSEWAVEGAQVVVETTTGATVHRTRTSTITKVNKTTFRVDGFDTLFRLRDGRTPSRGAGGYSCDQAYSTDSPEGRTIVRAATIRARIILVESTVSKITQDRRSSSDTIDVEKVDSAIAALQALRRLAVEGA